MTSFISKNSYHSDKPCLVEATDRLKLNSFPFASSFIGKLCNYNSTGNVLFHSFEALGRFFRWKVFCNIFIFYFQSVCKKISLLRFEKWKILKTLRKEIAQTKST